MIGYGAFAAAASAPTRVAPDTYAAFVTNVAGRSPSRRVAFGLGGPVDLGRYMDEVNAQAQAFDAWVSDLWTNPEGDDRISQGFFGAWNTYMNADPPTKDSRGRPLGWRAFYREYRGWLLPDYLDNWIFGTGEELWDQTEAFEDHMIHLYDWVVEEGGKPPLDRPSRKYQPPPPDKTIEGKVEGALKWVGIIGLVAAVGYVIHGFRKGD